jgi:sugar-specific transcriptional regulator TrmB
MTERAATKIKKELQRRLQRLEKELADAAEAESQPYTWRRWMSWWINRAIM